MTRGPSTGRLDRAEPLANPARTCKGEHEMPTLRLSIAGTLILALLGGPGGAVLAQEDAGGPVTVVTGTEECHMTTPGVTTMGEDGVERYRGHISMCEPDTSDPRMNGPYEMVWETDCYPDGRCVMWGTTKTVGDGPDGWQGRMMGWVEEDGSTSAVGYFDGYGANEGLTAVSGGSGGDLSGFNTVSSLLYQGDPPPLP